MDFTSILATSNLWQGNSTQYKRQLDILRKHFFRCLMRATIVSIQHRCQSLTIAIDDIRNELRSTSNDPDYHWKPWANWTRTMSSKEGSFAYPKQSPRWRIHRKADCETFFRRLRLKAHFSSDPSSARPPSQPSNKCEDPFKTIKHSLSNWTPPRLQDARLQLAGY